MLAPREAMVFGILILGRVSVVPGNELIQDCSSAVPFSEVSKHVGLDYSHFAGATGKYYIPEIAGGGGALFDFDGDGDLDVYVVQGGLVNPRESLSQSIFQAPSRLPLSDRLYRNDLAISDDGQMQVKFVDVTERSGIPPGAYGMGTAVADYDRDGWLDLYVTNYGSNRLLRNRGDGSFEDVTERAGVDDLRWSVSAAFVDFDHDGWLDLYVGNYVDFTVSKQVPCYSNSGLREYCGPSTYPGLPDRLFRNRGDGSFANVSGSSGLSGERGAALGVVISDFDGDDWSDIYVANDGVHNHLWINQRDGSFRNEALYRGCAVNSEGKSEGSMGVDVADFDNDGDEDLFVTHLNRETNTLYLNEGDGFFADKSSVSGLGLPSWKHTGFGTRWFDYNNDGHLDLFVANGAVRGIKELVLAGDSYPYHEKNQLFCNAGEKGYLEIDGGSDLNHSEVSRGAMFGDVDNDGDADIIVFNNNGPIRVLLNQVGNQESWLGIRPVGLGMATEQLGTKVSVSYSGATRQQRVRREGSYASSNDPRTLFGLGEHSRAAEVGVQWSPDSYHRLLAVPIARYITVIERDLGAKR